MREPGAVSVGRRLRRLLAVMALGLLGVAGPAAGQDPSVVARVDTTEINVGDRFLLRLEVNHPVGSSVLWPDSLDLAPFEALDARFAEPVETGGRLVTVGAITVTSFELGELDLPSVPVAVRDSTGSEVQLQSDPFRIGVVSIGLDESGDIRDIKGPLMLARDWGRLALWALLGLALLLMFRWLWSRRATPDQEAPVAPLPPSRPFHELAYEALDALEHSTLLEQGRVKEFHIRLSEIIRSYVEGQLRVPAMELTTAEVVGGLRDASLSTNICDGFRTFLERCDLVKFAKFRPSPEGSLELLGSARSLVDQTAGMAGRAAELQSRDATESPVEAVP